MKHNALLETNNREDIMFPFSLGYRKHHSSVTNLKQVLRQFRIELYFFYDQN